MRQRGIEFRVGLFVIVAIGLFAFTAFTIGAQRSFFAKKRTFSARFHDVEGLRPGSPVRVAGLTVGSVIRVDFTPQSDIEVVFQIDHDNAHLVRGNPSSIPNELARVPQPSRVSIGSKGMLGDKLVDVSIGDPRLPAWPENRPLPTTSSGGDVLGQASRVMAEAEGTARNLRLATDPFADQQFSNDLRTTASNLARITTDLTEGQGTLSRLLRDPAMAREVDDTIANVRTTSGELATTARSLRQIADEVRSGDGSAHRLIYGGEAADAAADIGSAAEEVAQMLRAVREGDGTLHGVVYGDEGHDLIANLTRASDDVAHITSHVRAGRGTIGGLLVDPSIYEDVKRLVGDLERNDVLRSLVRYSIRRDRPTEEAQVSPESRNATP
ncbi:MAG: MlaD family protein [Polyangiales bacterium]